MPSSTVLGSQSFAIMFSALLGFLLIVPIHAVPYQHWKRQDSNSSFPVIGVQNGRILPRLEIRDLQDQQPDQFNLLMLAMRSIQDAAQNDFLSHFQLAGIHGLPRNEWNGVKGEAEAQSPGYCSHVSNLFLPWHRPYLALYEQVLSRHALDAANSFPAGQQRDKFVNAANELRLPYWDWARSPETSNVVPDSMTRPQVEVMTGEGLKVIDNPLYSYKFHPVDPGLVYAPYVYWNQTIRWPTSTRPDAAQQDSVFIDQMNNVQLQVQQRLYNVLAGNPNFTEIGTSAWIPRQGPGSYDSLESIHDQVHGTIGGSNYGDMSVVPVSAFDPLFWLHHAFALWQALYPDSYVEPMPQKQGSFWTALKPFHSTPEGSFWTADAVRDTKTLGYTYPELLNADEDTIRSSINTLYGPSTSEKRRSKRAVPAHDLVGTLKDDQDRSNKTDGAEEALILTNRMYQINYRASKNSMGESFYIDFLFGQPASEDANTWLYDSSLIGSQAVLSTIGGAAPVTISGVLPLNHILENLPGVGALGTMTEDVVVKLLEAKITWRVRKLSGTSVLPQEIPELVISLSSIQVEPASSSTTFTKFIGDWKVYPQVTQGKPGGLEAFQDI